MCVWEVENIGMMVDEKNISISLSDDAGTDGPFNTISVFVGKRGTNGNGYKLTVGASVKKGTEFTIFGNEDDWLECKP